MHSDTTIIFSLPRNSRVLFRSRSALKLPIGCRA
jgi:hypothetical protein